MVLEFDDVDEATHKAKCTMKPYIFSNRKVIFSRRVGKTWDWLALMKDISRNTSTEEGVITTPQ